jgi:pyruvate,orthophosphate dikinase
MPEMMQSVLNLGMNSDIVKALALQNNNGRWALQTYIKFLKMFGTQVMGVDSAKFDEVVNSLRVQQNIPLDTLFTMEDLNEIVEKFKLLAIVPEDPWEQLFMAIEGSHKAWYSAKAIKYRDIHNMEDTGAAVTVQCMVYGNFNLLSGSGVAVTRNPNNGNKEFYGLYMANAEVWHLLIHCLNLLVIAVPVFNCI